MSDPPRKRGRGRPSLRSPGSRARTLQHQKSRSASNRPRIDNRTIRVDEDTYTRIHQLKAERGCKTANDVIHILLERYEIHEVVSTPAKDNEPSSSSHPMSTPDRPQAAMALRLPYPITPILAKTPTKPEVDNSVVLQSPCGLKRKYRKRSSKWDVGYIKARTFEYVGDLMARSLTARGGDPKKAKESVKLAPEDPRRISLTSARVAPQPTADIFAAKKSRLSTD